ncbi:MAG: class I SAM-dependent methyltransferase, partial [Candidatus Bathyarchaeota archaeon]
GRNPNNAQHKILDQVSPDSHVLEFGPAYGFMTKYMKERLGCCIRVVELDPTAARAVSAWATQTVTGDIENYEWLEAFRNLKFDYILFADVLEHLYDPWKVVRCASALLAPGGKLIMSIPNVAHSAVVLELMGGHFSYRSMGLLDNTHIRFFTLDSILALIDAADLNPILLDAVCKLPRATTLKRSYAEVSFWTGFAIARRPHAHVFQYIVTASAKQKKQTEARFIDRIVEPQYSLLRHLRTHIANWLFRIRS